MPSDVQLEGLLGSLLRLLLFTFAIVEHPEHPDEGDKGKHHGEG
jgi:hypothetical protein